jgi:hypothetical protein
MFQASNRRRYGTHVRSAGMSSYLAYQPIARTLLNVSAGALSIGTMAALLLRYDKGFICLDCPGR